MQPLLAALWLALVRFLRRLFAPSHAPSLPLPVSASAGEQARERTPAPAPGPVFHPPQSPFPDISVSGIFATAAATSPASLAPGIESTPPVAESTPPHRTPTPSCPSHSVHAGSPAAPSSPSSAVMVQADRSTPSPATLSAASWDVISLNDRRGSPVHVADIDRLPSPWSPVGRTTADVWMSVDGLLVNAAGPVDDDPTQTQDDSAQTATFSSLTLSRTSSASLYSTTSALDSFGISLLVNLSGVPDALAKVDTRHGPTSVPRLIQVHDDGSRPTLVPRAPNTRPRRRGTIPSAAKLAAPGHRATKSLSTPLSKLDNVSVSHARSASSISTMAYELRMGLFADGRSLTGFENIIRLLDLASPESTPPGREPVSVAVV